MNLPEIKNAQDFTSLYVVDFGDHSGVGFTTAEVAEILESEKYAGVKVYKIHNAYSDGKMELKAVDTQRFQLESGMFFYSNDGQTACLDFSRLVSLAIRQSPPGRAKVHLAKYDDEKFVTALIYPAEYEDQMSKWLLENDYKTTGIAEGGISQVENYYKDSPEIIDRHQLFADEKIPSRTGTELLEMINQPIQRFA